MRTQTHPSFGTYPSPLLWPLLGRLLRPLVEELPEFYAARGKMLPRVEPVVGTTLERVGRASRTAVVASEACS